MIKNSQYKHVITPIPVICNNCISQIAMALQAPMGGVFILLSFLSMGFSGLSIDKDSFAVDRLNWVKVMLKRGEKMTDWSQYEPLWTS